MIDALKRKDVAIEIKESVKEGDLEEEDLEEEDLKDLFKEFSKGKDSKALRNLGIIGVLCLPGIGAVLGTGAALAGHWKTVINDTSSYQIALFRDNSGKEHLIFVNAKKYDGRIDIIKGYEQYCFIGTKTYPFSCKCPKCGQKIRDVKEKISNMVPTICSKCHAKIIICKND